VRCPSCSDARSRVLETRFSDASVKRRRECRACDHRYSTTEAINGSIPLAAVVPDKAREMDLEAQVEALEREVFTHKEAPLPTPTADPFHPAASFEASLRALIAEELEKRDG
jgi:transcriptional regulator NrdR family protein